MHFIPPVKNLSLTSGCFNLSDLSVISFQASAANCSILAAQQLAQDMQVYAGIHPAIIRSLKTDAATIRLLVDESQNDQYTIHIDASGVIVSACSEDDLFYGCQTLRQIIMQNGRRLPCLSIRDHADFEVRGLYHDITRGKVPTFDSMCEIVEKASFYKINQLQLYVEHTFAFQKHKDIAAGKSPITAEEIMALDDMCNSHYIDLVPSLTTFGHCYEILRCTRLQHLNELELNGSDYPYSWWDRQAHFTLDSKNPEAFALVEDMLDEYMPLFSSEHFNICCDETIDLECGRHAATTDPAQLYLNFTKKVIDAVIVRGRKPQMWGDILQEHPECIADIPKSCTVLNWSYDPALTRGECKPFVKAGLPFYVCPGTSGWNHFFADLEIASQNISNFAKEGKKHGAIGLLNTDWGDYGHPGLFGASLHGIALGAACAWDADADVAKAGVFDAAFSVIELADTSGQAAATMRAFSCSAGIDTKTLALLFDPLTDIPVQESWKTGRTVSAQRLETYNPQEDYLTMATEMRAHREDFMAIISPSGALAESLLQDICCGMWGEILMHESAFLIQCGKGARSNDSALDYASTADEIRSFEQLYAERWHQNNKPSEYSRLRDFLMNIAHLLDSYHVSEG